MQSSPSPVFLVKESISFRVYPQRFWVLFIFALLVFNQNMFWLTFSPIACSAEKFFHISEATVDLLLNWGPIAFLPTLPLTYLLLNTHHGLRKCILIFAIVPVIATLSRLVPLVITSPTSANFHDVAVPFLHLGQILNAAVGPVGMALVSQLSCIWFAPHERTRATTIALVGASLGNAIGFAISPLIVSEPWRVPYLLYMHAGQAILGCVLTLAYFPAEPPSPPSVAAATLKAQHLIKLSPIVTCKNFAIDIVHCFGNLPCSLLLLAGAIMGGTFSAWAGLFATILTPLGYSQEDAGWFGFGQSMAGILGSLVMGHIADQPRFQRSFKALLLASLVLCFIFCLIFQLMVRTFLWPNSTLLPSSSASIGILLSIIGFFYGASSPLFYESLAEITYPLPESLSTSIFVQFFNLVALILLFVAPNRYQLMNLLVVLMTGISIAMVACARITYKRKDEELRKLTCHELETTEDVSNI